MRRQTSGADPPQTFPFLRDSKNGPQRQLEAAILHNNTCTSQLCHAMLCTRFPICRRQEQEYEVTVGCHPCPSLFSPRDEMMTSATIPSTSWYLPLTAAQASHCSRRIHCCPASCMYRYACSSADKTSRDHRLAVQPSDSTILLCSAPACSYQASRMLTGPGSLTTS